MKIGRSQDALSISATTEELAIIARHCGAKSAPKCLGTYDPVKNTVTLHIGEGRTFRPGRQNASYWTVALDVENSGAKSLDLFGLTPTNWKMGLGRKVIIDIPDNKAELQRRKPVIEKTRPYTPTTRFRPGLHAPTIKKPQAVVPEALQRITTEDLIFAQRVFNAAITQGYVPQYDARGRILYFDNRVGG